MIRKFFFFSLEKTSTALSCQISNLRIVFFILIIVTVARILRFPDDFQRCWQRGGTEGGLTLAAAFSSTRVEPKCPRVIDSGIPHGFH